jgi:hypothetical protein
MSGIVVAGDKQLADAMVSLILRLRCLVRPARGLGSGASLLISLAGLGPLAFQGLGPHRALPPAAAAPQPTVSPPLRRGEAYGVAQQRLLANGWRPQPRARQTACSILQADRRCGLFHELVACASTGPGFCRFHWHSPQGQSWALITVGGNPQGDPGSINTWFVIR